jgi:urea transporter/Ca2+-binding EF-hand superfamily protein
MTDRTQPIEYRSDDSGRSLHRILEFILAPEPAKLTWLERHLPTSGTTPAWAGWLPRTRPGMAIDSALRGVGQAIFINNPISGALILLALVLQSPWMALLAGLGVASAHVSAHWLGCSAPARRNGIFGFNGVLVGCAVGALGSPAGPGTFLVWILLTMAAAALSTAVMHTASEWILERTGLPPLTLPFCLVTWLLLGLAITAGLPLQTAAPPPAAIGLPQALALAVPRGFGQVFLCAGSASGLLVLLAVALASPLAGLLGLSGSFGGALASLLSGGSSQTVALGLAGYNGVLTAIAVGGTFYPPTRRSLPVAVTASLIVSLLAPFLAGLLPPGLPVLTLPFVLVTLATLLALRHGLPNLLPVSLHSIITAEEHRLRFQVARRQLRSFRGRLASPSRTVAAAATAAAAADEGDRALLERIEGLHRELDTNADGHLTVAEISAGFERGGGGISAEELALVLQAMDIDGNGLVDGAEFRDLMLRLRHLSREKERLLHYLLPVDADGNERIDRNEMNRVLASIGQAPLSPSEEKRLFGATPQDLSWEQFIDRLLLL